MGYKIQIVRKVKILNSFMKEAAMEKKKWCRNAEKYCSKIIYQNEILHYSLNQSINFSSPELYMLQLGVTSTNTCALPNCYRFSSTAIEVLYAAILQYSLDFFHWKEVFHDVTTKV